MLVYHKKTLSDLSDRVFEQKVVLLRCDFNVPMQNSQILNTSRIDQALETIHYLLKFNVKIVLFSHLGRISSQQDIQSQKFSLFPVFEYLQKRLHQTPLVFEPNNLARDLKQKIKKLPPKAILLLENTRYCDIGYNNKKVQKESKNNAELAKFWASLGDIFINDAFATAHRSHASNVGLAQNVPVSAIGLLVEKELRNLTKAIHKPQKPVVAIFGGAKISDKVATIKNIAQVADYVLIGGGMAYDFLKAKGYEIGTSLSLADNASIVKELLATFGDKIILPKDIMAAEGINATIGQIYKVQNFPSNQGGFDIGRRTIRLFTKYLKKAKTVIWNGPLGAFENPLFATGTHKICRAIAKKHKRDFEYFSVIGGGDSAAAAYQFGYQEFFSHISTGGGASLHFFAGLVLPGIEAILDKEFDLAQLKTIKKPHSIKPKKVLKQPIQPKPKKVLKQPIQHKPKKSLNQPKQSKLTKPIKKHKPTKVAKAI